MIKARPRPPKSRATVRDSWWIRVALTSIAVSFLAIFLLVPLFTVFCEALQQGLGTYLASFNDSAALAAIQLTLSPFRRIWFLGCPQPGLLPSSIFLEKACW